ncbi:MAG TPA: polysaccharide deacetylase family protein [Gemmatimonadaceae bacterium]|nr:polysaccharide deacetylase family protein [Gemmatimonadaceae bacterium]
MAVPALAYHKIAEIPADAMHRDNYVTPRQFIAQLRLLRALGYEAISFRDLLAHRRGEADLPDRPIVITFDDGYRSTLDFALPAVRAHGFFATVFVVTGLLGATNRWDADEIQECLVSADDVRRIAADGHDVQSHTRTHPDLNRLPVADALSELSESRVELERVLGTAVQVVAYPWGNPSRRVCDLAQRAGYAAGVILRRRVNFDSTSLFALRRIGINYQTSIARFAWDLARLRWRGE